jgi:hypothetical protein
MNNLRRMARGLGLATLVGFCNFVFGLGGLAWAQGQVGLGYAPDGQISQRLRSMRTRAGLPICQQSENLRQMGSTNSRSGT